MHASPALPVSMDWLDYVNEYPVPEAGISAEFPGPGDFRWRLDASYADRPAGGVLESGRAFWGSVGLILRKEISSRLDATLGPHLIVGGAKGAGEFELQEGDTALFVIDFDGSASGVGIGMSGGLLFRIGESFFFGPELNVIYFSLRGDDIPLVGRDLYDQSAEPDYTEYDYRGDYVSFSARITAGLEFGRKRD